MDDEQQLASLLLLLRLPLTNNDEDGQVTGDIKQSPNQPKPQRSNDTDDNDDAGVGEVGGDNAFENEASAKNKDSNEPPKSLRKPNKLFREALEHNDCQLLCFAGRLLNHFASALDRKTPAADQSPNEFDTRHSFSRLAVRVAFLRYASADTADEEKDNHDENERLWKYESCLLQALLAALHSRCFASKNDAAAHCIAGNVQKVPIEEVDVELAWAIRGLLLQLMSTTPTKLRHQKSLSVSSLWVQALDKLVVLKQIATSVPNNDTEKERDDHCGNSENQPHEKMMVQMINAVLDSHNLSSSSSASTPENSGPTPQEMETKNETNRKVSSKSLNGNNYWKYEYRIAVASCLRSFLETYPCINDIVTSNAPFPFHSSAASNSPAGHTQEGERKLRMPFVPKLSHRTLFELIRWSQSSSKGELSNVPNRLEVDRVYDGDSHWLRMEIYHLVLQYLRQCCRHFSMDSLNGSGNENHVGKLSGSSLSSFHSSSSKFNSCFASSISTDSSPQVDPLKASAEGSGQLEDAIRSFIFYGLVVLSNSLPNIGAHSDSTTMHSNASSIQGGRNSSSDTIRTEIYALVVELWQMFGPEWLYLQSLSTAQLTINDTSSGNMWWLPDSTVSSNGTINLGVAMPLCTLVRLAAGEFRLLLGQFVTGLEGSNALVREAFDSVAKFSTPTVNDSHCNALSQTLGTTVDGENSQGSSVDSSIVSGIEACARISIQAVHLMTELADENNGMNCTNDNFGSTYVNWTPDAILHIRSSLEDALNSSLQFFSMFSTDLLVSKPVAQLRVSNTKSHSPSVKTNIPTQLEVVGRTCCLIIGSIGSELEIDQLFSNPSANPSSHEGMEGTNFVHSFRIAILFSNTLSENYFEKLQSGGTIFFENKPFEEVEPLSYLLPCVMNLVASADFDGDSSRRTTRLEMLSTLLKEGHVALALSQFLNRTAQYWTILFAGTTQHSKEVGFALSRADTILSFLRLCLLVISELNMYGQLLEETLRHICLSFKLWDQNLNLFCSSSAPDAIRKIAKEALDQIRGCIDNLSPEFR